MAMAATTAATTGATATTKEASAGMTTAAITAPTATRMGCQLAAIWLANSCIVGSMAITWSQMPWSAGWIVLRCSANSMEKRPHS